MTPSHAIFEPIFGASWSELPKVLRDHYANRPFTDDIVTVEGRLDIQVSRFGRLLMPLFRLAGSLVPYAGRDIPVTVSFRSAREAPAFVFDRTFHIPGRKPHRFRSRMLPNGGNEVIELMPIGVGWRASYRSEGGKVLIEHRGYTARLWGTSIPLPLEALLGRGSAEEEAIDDTRFRMRMTIDHAIFGLVYGYSGEFTVTSVQLDA